jgi:hypothetical protein
VFVKKRITATAYGILPILSAVHLLHPLFVYKEGKRLKLRLGLRPPKPSGQNASLAY